jgi:hypothetical protein
MILVLEPGLNSGQRKAVTASNIRGSAAASVPMLPQINPTAELHHFAAVVSERVMPWPRVLQELVGRSEGAQHADQQGD